MAVTSTSQLTEFEQPALFSSTDVYAGDWQKVFLLCQKVQFGCLLLAAIGGATAWTIHSFRLSAAMTVLALVVAVYVRGYIYAKQPERKWYNGRAAAESVKTLAWKYTQCALPFPRSMSKKDVDELFIKKLGEVIATVPTLAQPVPLDSTDQITDDMRTLRQSKLTARKSYYISLRVDDQIKWYSTKATFNSKRSNIWAVVVVVLELVALIMAMLRYSGDFEFDSSGILGTAAGGALVWLQSRQHESLAQAYAVTSQELSAVKAFLHAARNEAEWASKVEQAEEAISREHTIWKATRH